MKPLDLLDLRADLAVRLKNNIYRTSIKEVMATAYPGARKPHTEVVVQAMEVSLRDAVSFYVAPDMCDLVEVAGRALDATDHYDMTLAPSRHGFVYFDKPIPMITPGSDSILISAALWYADRGDIVLHLWNDEYRHPDQMASVMADVSEEWKQAIGRWGYIGVLVTQDGWEIGESQTATSDTVRNMWNEMDHPSNMPDIPDTYTNPLRFLHALCLLLGQTLTATQVQRGDRKMVRRMMRMSLPHEVTVITFRRRESHNEYAGESAVEWSHRWLVRGFWRWQPYKDEDGNWQHRRQWIAPYVKGPADKPLVITQKVNAFTR